MLERGCTSPAAVLLALLCTVRVSSVLHRKTIHHWSEKNTQPSRQQNPPPRAPPGEHSKNHKPPRLQIMEAPAFVLLASIVFIVPGAATTYDDPPSPPASPLPPLLPPAPPSPPSPPSLPPLPPPSYHLGSWWLGDQPNRIRIDLLLQPERQQLLWLQRMS